MRLNSSRRKRLVPWLLSALLALVLSITWMSYPGLLDAPENPTLTVMSYNIRVGVGGGAQRLPAAEGLEKVARVIERYKPDVLLVQEIEKGAERTQGLNEVDWLRRRLDFTSAAFAPAIRDGSWSYGVALFGRFQAQVSSGTYLLYKPDYSESHPEYPAYYSEQRVLLRATGCIGDTTLSFYCTHLGLTADQRERQVQDILQHLERESHPIILGGDFNAQPGSAELKPLRERYRDVFEVLSVPMEQRWSFPAGTSPKRAIDTIFVSPGIEVLRAFVIRDESLASDHNPVVAELRLPGP